MSVCLMGQSTGSGLWTLLIKTMYAVSGLDKIIIQLVSR